MDDKVLVSVIVPVYNIEKYLGECLDSIVNQTYKNLQIILVDDGSTDTSGKICDEYAEKDKRITVVHQANQGAGAAKNTGLELINGEYFSIIDSDDYVDLTMYEKMISLIKVHNSDIAQCLFTKKFQNKEIKQNLDSKDKSVTQLSSEAFLRHYLLNWIFAVFWNKLFKTSLLKDIRFPEGRKIDDEFFTYKLVCNANNIVSTSDSFYYYRMRKSSVMNNNRKDRLIFDRIDCFVERYEYVSSRFPKLKKAYYDKLADSLLFYKSQLSEESEKVNNLIEKYPYEQPGIITKIINRFSRPKTVKPFENSENCILFE